MKRLMLCLMGISCWLRGAAGPSFDYVPFHIESPEAKSSDLAKIMKGGVRDVMRAHELGAGDGAEARIVRLISSWRRAVEEAKNSVSSKGLFESQREYAQRVQRVLRRLYMLKDVVAHLTGGKVEKAREYFANLMNMYTASYADWKATYEANFEPFQNYEILKNITPHTIYQELGITVNPSEFSYEDINQLIMAKEKRIGVQYPASDASLWFGRQMRYLFPNPKAKECFDAWLQGPANFAAWQQAELASLGLDIGVFQELALGMTVSLITFKNELLELGNQIQKTIDEIVPKSVAVAQQ